MKLSKIFKKKSDKNLVLQDKLTSQDKDLVLRDELTIKDSNSVLEKFREEELEKDRLWDEERERDSLYYEKQDLLIKKFTKQYLVPIRKQDYCNWIEGYIKNGGTPSHSYDYDMSLRNFFVATKDFKIFPLYGASSISIIIPSHINFLGGEVGHSNLYFMNNYIAHGECPWVPIYTDIKF